MADHVLNITGEYSPGWSGDHRPSDLTQHLNESSETAANHPEMSARNGFTGRIL